jgi:hypothetical protein
MGILLMSRVPTDGSKHCLLKAKSLIAPVAEKKMEIGEKALALSKLMGGERCIILSLSRAKKIRAGAKAGFV